ncbi:MAG TPA: glycosyltransferase family 2 protein [Bacteroidia bacterium]|nr:glycosyltransferase family 2 protein [Bacteroidia bacterium]
MDVSVIIINYNTYALTSRCIASVFEFTKDLSFEIILVDNASTECDPGKFTEEFPGITLVRNAENTGFAKGNNTGIEKASGKYILLLNSDTELKENSIRKCIGQFAQEPAPGIVTCRLVYPDGRAQFQCQRFPSVALCLLELFRLHKLLSAEKKAKILSGPFFSHTENAWPESVWGTFFLFPAKILRELPGEKLPDDFFMYGEDLEWCYVFRKKGYRAFYYAGTSVIHHHGASASEAVLEHKHRNEFFFLRKYRGDFYARTLMFFRSLLWLTSRDPLAGKIRRISFRLFLKGAAA